MSREDDFFRNAPRPWEEYRTREQERYLRPIITRMDAAAKNLPWLEDWVTMILPEGLVIVGTVFGHPVTPDGTRGSTGPVLWWRRDLGIARAATGTFVLLGSEQRRSE